MNKQDLRIGNTIEYHLIDDIGPSEEHVDEWIETNVDWQDLNHLSEDEEGFNEWHRPIPLSEEVLVRCGYTMIQESSAGKVWAFVVDGVFSSDLKIIQWKTTERAGKFYRGELELQGLHHLQNIQYALTGHELELKK